MSPRTAGAIRSWRAALVAAALIAAPFAAMPAAAAAAATLYEALRTAPPDGRTIAVEEWTLERGPFAFHFEQGSLHLLRAVEGKTSGAVFIGRGSLILTPAEPGERRALALRGATDGILVESFREAYLLFGRARDGGLRDAGPARAGQPAEAAASVLAEWPPAELSKLGVDPHLRILRARLNAESEAGPFYAFVRGERLDRLLVAVDPMGVLDDEGACLVVDGEGGPAYWFSGRLPVAVSPLVDARHYSIESRVDESTSLSGVTTVDLEVLSDGLRVLPVDLYPSLVIRTARLLGEAPVALKTLQSPAGEGGTAILFPQPLPRGSSARLQVEYSGDEVLEHDGANIYKVRARANWYANLGVFSDRATYELTFRVPQGSTVVAVGRQVSERGEGSETVSVWRAERPIAVAGFNFGDFKRYEREEENTGMELEVYASKGTPDVVTELNQYLQDASGGMDMRSFFELEGGAVVASANLAYSGPSSVGLSTDGLADAAMRDAVNATQVFTRFFGPLAAPRLAITNQSQWSFGQAWPGLVYLPYLLGVSSLLDVQLGIPGYAGFVGEVGIHEIAHQWWGHHVGWKSYRDQWLSEGFAEFSTAMVVEMVEGADAHDDFWERRRHDLLSKSPRAEHAPYHSGPVTLGFRVANPASPGAAHVVMYSKGGYILHMLRMLMRDYKARSDARFFAMMRDYADTWAGREASTEDFRDIVQKHMIPELDAAGNGRVDWFFDQWVYGTEVPTLTTEVAVEKVSGNKWRLRGTLTQSGVSDGFLTLVPTYIDLGKKGMARFGRAPFRGNMSREIDVTLELPRKPKAVLMNAGHEVLAFD